MRIPYPSPTPLLTPGGSAAAGKCRLPRVYRDIGSLYPVQIFNPHFDMMFGCFVFGLKSFAFQKITVGWCRSFFIGGGMDCSCLRLRGGLTWIFVELPLTAPLCQFCMVQAHFTNCAGCKSVVKKAFVRLKLQENRHSVPYKLPKSSFSILSIQAFHTA